MNPTQNVMEYIIGNVKYQIMMLLNETADEFDQKNLTPEQRQAYNDFTGAFGQKVLAINGIKEPDYDNDPSVQG